MIRCVPGMLAMVALFEGSSGGRVNTWDEQLLSLGTLHYAVGQGPGLTFLQRIRQLDPAGFRRCLGPDFDAAAARGAAALTAFIRQNVWRSTRYDQAFAALSRLGAFEQADAEAALPYLQGAQLLAARYGLTSERGLAFCFDRSVQQGWAPRAGVDAVYQNAQLRTVAEPRRLELLARAYAAAANPKYYAVVLERSLTVAQGSSAQSGYPGDVNLERDFGVSAGRAWNASTEVVPGVPRVFLKDAAGKYVLWKPGDVYVQVAITPAYLSQLALVYPPGSSGTAGPIKVIRSAQDGALLLERA